MPRAPGNIISWSFAAAVVLFAVSLCFSGRLPHEAHAPRSGTGLAVVSGIPLASRDAARSAMIATTGMPASTAKVLHEVRAVLRHQLVVGAGDSLARFLINALRDPAVDGVPYLKRPVGGDAKQVMGASRGQPGFKPRFLFESHLLFQRAGALKAAVAGAVRRVTQHGDGRPGLLVLSHGLWGSTLYGELPTQVARQLEDAVAAVIPDLTQRPELAHTRIVVYMPHCHPATSSSNTTGCFVGARGESYRRALACAVGALAASYGPQVRIDVYDVCDWARNGTADMGSAFDGLHFKHALPSMAADFAARFATNAPRWWADAARSSLAWSTDAADRGHGVAAAVHQRYQCPPHLLDPASAADGVSRDVNEHDASDALSAEHHATTYASLSPGGAESACAADAIAVERDECTLGWTLLPACACESTAPGAAFADGCRPTGAVRGLTPAHRTSALGASLCALRKLHLECPQRNLTTLDLDGALAPGQPAFEEALLTVCAAPEAFGLCMQNLGASIGRSSFLRPGSPELRRLLRRAANATPADAASVCRCGFRFAEGATNHNATGASPWCAAAAPRLERARAIFVAARESDNALDCSSETLAALNLCAAPAVRAAAFGAHAVSSHDLAGLLRHELAQGHGRAPW